MIDWADRAGKNRIQLWPLVKDESPKSGSGFRIGSPRVLAEGLPYRVQALAFSPDGRALALPDDGGTVRVLETATGKERVRFAGHAGQVYALAFSPDGRRLASGSLDTTALVWDVTGRLHDERLRPSRLTATEREALWVALSADDAGAAGNALWALAADPTPSVAFLAGQLHPVARPAPEALAGLLRGLDDESFDVRVKARGELEKLGAVAEPALRRALEETASAEVRRRLDELLSAVEEQRKSYRTKPRTLARSVSEEGCKLFPRLRFGLVGRRSDGVLSGSSKRPPADVLRGLRAVEVLEQIGSRDARKVLAALAAGAPGAALTQEAHAALERLERASRAASGGR